MDKGTDTVYTEPKNTTNVRDFPGLNFDQKFIIEGICYIHECRRHVLMAISTYAQAGQVEYWGSARRHGDCQPCALLYNTRMGCGFE